MDAQEAYEAGREALESAWSQSEHEGSPVGPAEVTVAIDEVMTAGTQVSHRYALVVQTLLKVAVGDPDARRLASFPEIDGQFSARSFAKETVVRVADLAGHLGRSSDPYVSNPLRKERLEDELLDGRGGQGWQAVFAVLDHLDAHPADGPAVLIRVLHAARTRPAEVEAPPLAAAPPSDLSSLVAATSLDENRLLDILDALESDQPQVIFAGPPGTSKTYAAEAIASYLVGGDLDRVRVTQFHASYGYEDFIEGLRPSAVEGAIRFDVEPGAVRRITSEMQGNDTRVLILDEMNRANLPRVLGELLYALEHRGEPVDLMYTPGFELPPGLAFIGTMNTADRSIRSIDAAVRRRFQIFDFPPDATVLQRFYEAHPNEVDDLITGFSDLNERLATALDRHHTIGHTFFMDARGMNATRLRRAWDRQVLPLIEEYLFDQPDLLGGFRLEAIWPSTEHA